MNCFSLALEDLSNFVNAQKQNRLLQFQHKNARGSLRVDPKRSAGLRVHTLIYGLKNNKQAMDIGQFLSRF